MRRLVLVSFLLAALLPAVGCETDVPTDAERQAITAEIRPFLEHLALAYAKSEPKQLEGYAAPRMIEEVRNGIIKMQAGGARLEPTLKSVEITEMKVARHAMAIVNCTEVWDTKRFDPYSGEMTGRDENSVLHSHIQLRIIDGKWTVLFREVDETATGPRLMLPTPTPK